MARLARQPTAKPEKIRRIEQKNEEDRAAEEGDPGNLLLPFEDLLPQKFIFLRDAAGRGRFGRRSKEHPAGADDVHDCHHGKNADVDPKDGIEEKDIDAKIIYGPQRGGKSKEKQERTKAATGWRRQFHGRILRASR